MSSNDPEWLASFTAIRDTHDRVYSTIDTAIQCEEAESPQLALVNYKLSVLLIDEALATPVGLPDDDVVELDETWDQAIKMIEKMKRTRGELTQRIATLSAKLSSASSPSSTSAGVAGGIAAPPPETEEFVDAINCECSGGTSDGPSERPWNHSELSNALHRDAFVVDDASQLQLIYTCDNVKLYHIAADGEVSTTAENSVLRVLCMAGNSEQRLQATFFLQIIDQSLSVDSSPTDDEKYAAGTIVDGVALATEMTATTTPPAVYDQPWIYPLVPGVSPCYYTKFGAFIFPDLYTTSVDQTADASVGIVVPAESEEVLIEVLDAILQDVVRETRLFADDGTADSAPSRKTRSTSVQVSDGLVAGASYIARGLIFSSTKAGEFVERNTPYVMSKMARAPQDPHSEPVVSRGMVTSMEVAKTATGMAASLTGYVAEKVGSATMALGRFLAPHVQSKGTKLLSHTMGYSEEEAADKMSGVLTVAAGAVEGVGTVYAGLEQSAALLGNSLGNNTVRVIEHKYGASAGELAADTFDTVGNMINIGHNVSILTPKSLVKKTAKNASKAMIQAYRPAGAAASLGRSTVPASHLYPELSQFSKAVAAQKSTSHPY